MSWATRLRQTVQIGLVVAVVALFVGSVLGQPVLLSFVETGSMEPTLEPGDGFVAIPDALTGPPAVDDVIVFEAEEIQGGGLTTHRVVEIGERGYITRGDNNPFRDQDGDEPPVDDAQVVAHALQVNGDVLRIPQLGTGVMLLQGGLEQAQQWIAVTFGVRGLLDTQGIATVLFGLSVLAYVGDIALDRLRPATRDRTRTQRRDDGVEYRLLIAGAVGVIVIAATAAMVVPAGTTQLGIVSAEFSSEQPTVIEQGTTAELPYALSNGGLVPTVTYLSTTSEDVEIPRNEIYLGPRGTAAVDLTVTAPETTGFYRQYVTEHRYLAVLPRPVIGWLYDLHPWLPGLVINGVLAGTIYAIGRVLLPTGKARLRQQQRGNQRG